MDKGFYELDGFLQGGMFVVGSPVEAGNDAEVIEGLLGGEFVMFCHFGYWFMVCGG